jgi:hypothetical protein
LVADTRDAWSKLNADFALGMAMDSTSIYWNGSATILKVPVGGGCVTTLASGQNLPTAIALDATSAYWLTGNGNLMKQFK